jgi:hypothetical protein
MLEPGTHGPSTPLPEKHNGVPCCVAPARLAMVRLPFESMANSGALAELLTTKLPPAGWVTVTSWANAGAADSVATMARYRAVRCATLIGFAMMDAGSLVRWQ